jgi:hypothetical protein
MAKKPFTTRLDESVLEMAQAIAEVERRSVTSVIEVAIMDYVVKVEATHGPLPIRGPAEGGWLLKIHRQDGGRLPDRTFLTVDGLLAEARSLTAEHPHLKLVVTVPSDASEEDQEKVRQAGYTEALWPNRVG